MSKFTVRAFEPDGTLAFGVTLNCADDDSAIARFNRLPVGDRRAELLYGSRLVAWRDASPFPARSACVPNKG